MPLFSHEVSRHQRTTKGENAQRPKTQNPILPSEGTRGANRVQERFISGLSAVHARHRRSAGVQTRSEQFGGSARASLADRSKDSEADAHRYARRKMGAPTRRAFNPSSSEGSTARHVFSRRCIDFNVPHAVSAQQPIQRDPRNTKFLRGVAETATMAQQR